MYLSTPAKIHAQVNSKSNLHSNTFLLSTSFMCLLGKQLDEEQQHLQIPAIIGYKEYNYTNFTKYTDLKYMEQTILTITPTLLLHSPWPGTLLVVPVLSLQLGTQSNPRRHASMHYEDLVPYITFETDDRGLQQSLFGFRISQDCTHQNLRTHCFEKYFYPYIFVPKTCKIKNITNSMWMTIRQMIVSAANHATQ